MVSYDPCVVEQFLHSRFVQILGVVAAIVTVGGAAYALFSSGPDEAAATSTTVAVDATQPVVTLPSTSATSLTTDPTTTAATEPPTTAASTTTTATTIVTTTLPPVVGLAFLGTTESSDDEPAIGTVSVAGEPRAAALFMDRGSGCIGRNDRRWEFPILGDYEAFSGTVGLRDNSDSEQLMDVMVFVNDELRDSIELGVFDQPHRFEAISLGPTATRLTLVMENVNCKGLGLVAWFDTELVRVP